MWDAFGKATARRICDLVGGQVRQNVPFSADLFYKLARHAHDTADNAWGAVLTPEQLANQARQMVDEHGFKAIKLKGGVLAPEEEIAGLHAPKVCVPRRTAVRRPKWRLDCPDLIEPVASVRRAD